MIKKKEIIFAVTGSIAAYKSCEIIRRLKEEGFSVTVIMTKEAEKFITFLSLQTLSERKVYRDMFIELEDFQEVAHISLVKKAGLILIAPATANIIGKIAAGIADDLLSTMVLSTKSKIIIAPAMNENMYRNRIVQENIRKLKTLGMHFVGPIKGKLVCGDIGIGCLAPVDIIVGEVKNIIRKK